MTKEEIVSLRIRRAISKDLGLAGIMLYVILVVDEAANVVAATDGQKVYFGPAFFVLDDDEQVAVCIHETLHVAFRHVQRGAQMREREGSGYNQRLWNIACDAVINVAIKKLSWAKLPPGAVDILDWLSNQQTPPRPPERWTTEEVYAKIKSLSVEVLEKCPVVPSDLEDRQGASVDPRERESESNLWRERVLRAQAGASPLSVLRRLAGDLPRSSVSWEKALRAFLKSHIMPRTTTSWSRPGRRTLALGAEARFIEPGVERKQGIHRLGVVIDTSGSISDSDLTTFISEINSIMRLTAAEVVLVDCDAAVHQVTTFRAPIRDYTPHGGSGTDFRPGLAELGRHGVSAVVYFTDLCGTFPERPPRFPLLWATKQDISVPFGRKVLLPQSS